MWALPEGKAHKGLGRSMATPQWWTEPFPATARPRLKTGLQTISRQAEPTIVDPPPPSCCEIQSCRPDPPEESTTSQTAVRDNSCLKTRSFRLQTSQDMNRQALLRACSDERTKGSLTTRPTERYLGRSRRELSRETFLRKYKNQNTTSS